MILAIDVYYNENKAKAVGVLFDWMDDDVSEYIIQEIEQVEDYIPGQFYKRELPCIMSILKKVNIEEIDAIIVDGHIFIDNDKNWGLGAYLYHELNESIPIIGLAKSAFKNNDKTVKEILRGESKKPLFVSSIGVDLQEASNHIQKMKGEYRMPHILKLLDIKTKN